MSSHTQSPGGHPGTEQIIAIAEGLVPHLRDYAQRAEELRRIPDQTISKLEESGLLAMASPVEHGGWACSPHELSSVVRVLGSACASTAWVFSFFVIHHVKMALTMNEAGLRLVTGGRPYSLAASSAGFSAVASGTATPVDGGWRLTGKWPFASGVMNADWVFVYTNEAGAEEGPPLGLALRVTDLKIDDVWHFSGMKGTGSNTISAENLFVSSDQRWYLASREESTGTAVTTELGNRERAPMEKVTALRLFDTLLPAIALGAAEAALDTFHDLIHKRVIAFGMGRQIEKPEAWARYAKAHTLVRLARLLWQSNVDMVEDLAKSGLRPTAPVGADLRLGSVQILNLTRDAVAVIMDGAGSSPHHESHPLQRIQRDIDVMKSHNYLHWDDASTQAGRAYLGLEPTHFLLTS